MVTYAGCVTDQCWYRALWELRVDERIKYLEKNVDKEKYIAGINYIYKLNRFPRIYLDEHNKQGGL